MVSGVTPEDLAIAQKLVSTSPGYLSKWTKSELVSAAIAMRLFIRELPGGPKLLRRAMDLARSTNGGEDERMSRAVKAINRQEGVDASLYRPTQATGGASATSTQSTAENSDPNWDDLSQIPSNQDGGGGRGVENEGEEDETVMEGAVAEKGEKSKNSSMGLAPPGEKDDDNNGSSNRGGGNTTVGGKVSDPSFSNAHSLAAPIRTTTPHGPHKRAQGGGNGDGVVDAGANDVGVARRGGIGGVGADAAAKQTKRGSDTANNTTTTPEWRPRVCNQVWRGGTCKNRSKGCRFAHPSPCGSNGCTITPAPNCRAFHPRRKGGNDRGDERKGNAAPKNRKGSNGPSGPSSSSSKGNGSGNSNKTRGPRSNSNSNNRSALRLGDRVARVERQLGGMSGTVGTPSYRDVTVRGLCVPPTIGGSNGGSSGSLANKGGFGLAQPDPGMLSTVVAAVMAVLSGRGQQF